MKKIFLIVAFLCMIPVFLGARDYKIDEVYDLFSPTLKVPDNNDPNDPSKSHIPPNRWGDIWINGDLDRTSRVSMFPVKQGTAGDPKTDLLLETDEHGTALIPEEKDCPTEYCQTGYYGGEDTRAFTLHGGFSINPDGWKRIVFEFIPRRDGKVQISIGYIPWRIRKKNLEGNWIDSRYYDHGYVRYAKFWAKNTSLRDLNVGSASAWNIRPNWNFPKQIKPKSVMEKNAPVTKSMRSPMRLSQIIPVKKNKKVIIAFYIHGDDYFRAKKWFDPDEDKDREKSKEKKERRNRRRRR